MRLREYILASALLVGASAPVASAGWLGSSVSATINNIGSGLVLNQQLTPSTITVGGNMLSEGIFNDPVFGQIFDVYMGFSASAVTLSIGAGSANAANLYYASGSPIFAVDINNIDSSVGIALTPSYQCSGGCAIGDGSNDSAFLHTTPYGEFVANFTDIEVGQTYTFAVNQQTVPEPSSIALLGTGLIGLGLVCRRRRGRA